MLGGVQRRHAPQKTAAILDERMLLQPSGDASELPIGRVCPSDRVLTLLDVLLCKAAPTVEGHDTLGGASANRRLGT